ncbi:MAG: hypothetical protein AB8G11_03175 [Saprospiraceae bacterium]
MFGKLKSLFVIEENVPTKPKSKAKTKSTKSTAPSKGNSIVKTTMPKTPVIVSSTDVKGQVSDKFLKILFDALEKNNLEGFDYLEFKKSLQSLSAMPMDEATRFKSAFAMANSMNVTTKQIMDSADFYLQILGQEEQKFNNALAQQKSTKVHAQEEQVKQLEKNVKFKADQIKKLTEEIDKLQQTIKSTNAEISKQTTKVTKTKNDFTVSYDAVVGQIKTDINNMKKYLGGNNETPKEEVKK